MKQFHIAAVAAVAAAALVVPGASAEAGTRYKVKATAKCTDCGSSDWVAFETTGRNYATPAACERARREIVSMGPRFKLRIRARCVAVHK